MNFSTSTKDAENCAKNEGMFHHDPLKFETLVIWIIRYHDIHGNSMADLPYATLSTIRLLKFSRSDNDLYSSYR
ncbi:unnamed protein product [Hymenolepis diminuta]|uniref:Uncharacterized protein n=1 Tax=Hymenolepis diminuta TaxID=6216 RepID=A0A564Y6F0_HYMDI|nr:unnamed protein product [Hymenolepis diminuta]